MKLLTLSMNGNQLRSFPESLGKCVLLEKIFAENNKLQVVGEEFRTLVKLDEINLGNNELQEIPSSWGALRLLQVR